MQPNQGGGAGAAKVGASTLTEKLDGGAPLPAANRTQAESSLGVDLSAVRVHTGPAAEKQAAGISAQAYTQGNDIYFGAGQYAPGTPEGDHLIAHELTHVAQQAGGAVAAQPRGQVTDVAEPAEVEAEHGASAILSGKQFRPRGATS